VKIKTWGDALRNTITKMPSEGIDVVLWFISIDKLFEQLTVPADLQAILIRPCLSDRAKLLMSKCDPTHSAKYENVKAFLLKELHLSPAVYLEKFNSLTQDKSETQFSTRLMSLFDYYLESRKTGQSYDKLTDLMVYDRVKSCLSQALSRYVLSLEANDKEGWIGRQGLAEALDSYLANLPESSGRSRFVPVPQAKQESNQVIEKERPVLGMLCLRDSVLGLAVCILSVKVKGQFRHQDLYRDGVTCVIHRHI